MNSFDDLIQSLDNLNTVFKNNFFDAEDTYETINYIKTDNEELSKVIQPIKEYDRKKKMRIIKILVSLNRCSGNITDGLTTIQETLQALRKDNENKND